MIKHLTSTDYNKLNANLACILADGPPVPYKRWIPSDQHPSIKIPFDAVASLPPIIDKMIQRHGVKMFIHNHTPMAHCEPGIKEIFIPKPSQFKANMFHHVLFHELTHTTIPELGRLNLHNAVEEIIADIGAMYLCEAFGIEYVKDQVAAYVDNWASSLYPAHAQWAKYGMAEAQRSTQYLLEKAK